MTTATETLVAAEVPLAEPDRAWGAAKKAFALTAGLRVLYSALAAAMSPILYLDPGQISRTQLTSQLMQRDPHPVLYALLGVWERFDTLWYIRIANHGYDLVASAVFYPLYPLLIRAFSGLIHNDLVSALLITNLATFFFFWAALRVFELHTSPRNALRAVVLWGLFPDAFIFFSGYPDSLLLALTLWSLYFASRRRWLTAGLLGLAAGCTKAFGCLSLIPILYFGWRDRNWRSLPAAVLTIAGPAAFQFWLALHHFPSTSHIYATYWQTTTSMPWTTIGTALRHLLHGDNALLLLNFGLLVVVFSAGWWARVPMEYRLFCSGAFLLIATKNTDPVFQSSVRYALILFAAFPALARKLEKNFNFTAVLLCIFVLNLFLLRVYLDWGLVV